MSDVSATPQAIVDAAGNLAKIGSTIHTANANAAAGTAGVKAPGADAVSAYLSALFAAHAQTYHAAGAQAAAYHDLFVQTLREGAGSYASTEAANASHLDKVGGIVSATNQVSAGHATASNANVAMGTGQQGGSGGPSNGPGAASGPGADSRATAVGGPQGGNAGGSGANAVSAGDGGGPGGGGSSGGVGQVADPGSAGVTAAWAPAGPVASAGPPAPGLATPGAPPAFMAGGYPAAAGLGVGALGGDSAAFGGLAQPAAAAASPVTASPVAASPSAEATLAAATKPHPLHPGNPNRSGDAAHPADSAHDIPAVPLPLPRLRGLRRKLRERSGFRDRGEWREELREAARTKPWGRDELLGALGLRPPSA
jgi:PE family